MKFPAFLLLPLLVAASLRAQPSVSRSASAAEAEARVTVSTAGRDGISIRIEGLRLHRTDVGGRSMIAPNLSRYLAVADTNAVPGLSFTIAVPFDAVDVRAEVAASTPGTDGLSLTSRDLLHTASGPVVGVGGAAVIRGMRTIAVRYAPARVEAGRATVPAAATLRVTWRRSGMDAAKGGRPRAESPSMEVVLRDAMLNYDQAKEWRRPENVTRSPKSAGVWGMERAVVISTGSDGVYSLSGAELAATGASGLLGAPIDRLRLRVGALPVRFFVDDRGADGSFDANDRLEFVGRRHPSDEPGFYYSDITDTNAYVLRWDGAGTALPRTGSAGGAAAAPMLAAYDSTLHIERENIYFPGPTPLLIPGGDAFTVHVSNRVRLERFYWERVLYPLQAVLHFDCSPAYRDRANTVIGLHLVGVADIGNAPHSLSVRLNGIEIGRPVIAPESDTTVAISVPTNFLLNGRNEMTVAPLVPDGEDPIAYGSGIHTFYVDYLELHGSWLPTAWDDAPKVSMPADADGPRRAYVSGFTTPPTTALSADVRVPVDSVQRGRLYRVISRQFDNVALRQYPGFVAQIGDTQITTPAFAAGMMLIEVGPTGSVVRNKFYELYAGGDAAIDAGLADALAFLQGVPQGNTIIAGFTVGTANRPVLPAELNAAFAALGSTKAQGNNFVASWAFAARKGDPSTATEAYAHYEENSRGVSIDAFIPNAAGDRYRAVVTLDGPPGREYQLGAPLPAPLRYHADDSLTAPANRADMIIITHPAFRADAERLAAYRSAHPPAPGPFVVRVVDVNTVYDEFSNGVKSAPAINRFLQYADSNWAAPSPGYVLLFGDASWDPMRRLPGSRTIDYVPTNGIPATDYTYTVPVGDTVEYAWQQVIGRLPAASAGDARAMVDKIIDYESKAPALWNKRFVFLAGGATEEEVSRHVTQNTNLAENYVLSNFFYGDTAMIQRTGKDPDLHFPDSKDAEWARSEVNKGTIWMNFSGHGATDIADLDYGFPEQFDNGDRYFMLGTFSCQTGAFAEPSVQVRNERFLTYPGRGAIAAIGGTSFSFPYLDINFKQQMFAQITQPAPGEPRYARVIGSIFTIGKYEAYFRQYTGGSFWWLNGLDGYFNRNTLLMYNLLGDPSMRLGVSDSAELAFTDVAATNVAGNAEPAPGDSVITVRARLWNYGMPAFPVDSFPVVASITDRNQERRADTTWVTGLGRSQDLTFTLPIAKEAGEYTIRIEADPEATVPEHYREDDDTTFTLRIRGNQVQAIDPLPFGRLTSHENITIRLLNPPTGPGAEFMLDTTPRFDSPARLTSRETGSVSAEELATTWTFSMPAGLRTATRFWWRATSLAGDTALVGKYPISESFTVADPSAGEYLIGGAEQMARAQIVNLVNASDGVGPGARRVPIYMKVHGQSAFDTTREPRVDIQNFVERNSSVVIIDGKDYNRPADDGINLVMFRGGRAYGSRQAFAFYRSEDVDRFLAVVDTMPSDVLVIAWANGVAFDLPHRPAEVRAALRSLGASQRVMDSIWREDSYALIGGKTLPPDRVRESWTRAVPLRAQGLRPPFYVVLADTIAAPAGSGTLTLPVVGPATAWADVRFDRTPGPAVPTVVMGVRRDGRRDTVLRMPDATTADLSGVSVAEYPRLEFRLNFPEDSTIRLRSMSVRYTLAPELAIVPSTLRLEQDSVLQGDDARLNATLVNLSPRAEALGVAAQAVLPRDGTPTLVDTLRVARIGPGDSVRHAFTIATDKMHGDNAVALLLNETDMPPEIYRTNNTLRTSVRVGGDAQPPRLAIYADHARLMDGDYVVPRPLFEVRVMDNSSLRLDSSSVKLIVDNDFITAGNGGVFQPAPVGNGEYRGSFYYTPVDPLKDGEHVIRVILSDASGNGDTTRFIPFYVERNLGVRNVVNWPNPFVDKTTFTFMVTGGTPPSGGEIGIYTVTGRKVKTIRLSAAELNVGFNRVDWDGLDEDHDRLANGVYLYKVRVDAADLRQETIDKLVIMR